MAQISYDTLTITNIPDNLRQNFWVETTNYSSQIPAGVYITQNSASSFKNNPSGPNIFMQATNDNNGIRLRQGLLTLAEIMSDRFRLYTPNGSTQGLLGLSLDATDGLVLYRTNNNALMAEVAENTIPSRPVIDTEVFLSQISTVGNHQFIYHVSGENYYWTYNESEVELTDYGITFSAIEGAPSWADGEYLTIRVFTSVIAEKGVQLSSAGLGLFGSSQSTADVTVDSGGINIGKGKIIGGEVGSSYIPKDDFLYLSTQNYGSYLNVADSGFRKNWRLVIGKYFGVTEGGNAYLNGATISGKIIAMTGQIGGTSVGGSLGWTLKLGQLYSGTMGSDNSLHMRTLNLGTNDEAVSINNCAPRKDWRLTVGSKFGVTSTGELFADGANLTNINAGSINIGPVVKYYVCDTEAATPAKTIDNVSNFSLVTGLTINVTFTYGNTSSAPTLNINDTGAISIKSYDGSNFNNSYEYNIAAGSSRTFTYNGTYWLLQDNGAGDAYLRAYNAEDNAYGYITTISGIDGISVRRKWDNTNFVNIRDDGVHIYKTIDNNKVDVSFFGEIARIGQVNNNKSRVEIKDTGIDFYNRSSDTDKILAHIGYDTGQTSSGSTSTTKFPYYTFGIRASNTSSTRGNYSVAEGVNTTASGYASHAEGGYTTAGGMHAHTEGFQTTTNGVTAHAEGDWSKANGHASHAEGYYTTASGDYSHTEGYKTFARSDCAHSNGYEVRADGKYSSVCGKYNSEDASCFTRTTDTSVQTNKIYYYKYANNRYEVVANPINTELWMYYELTGDGEYAFIIGNGTSTVDRSNALTVDWKGNIKAGGLDCGVVSITPTAGSVTSKQVTFNHTFSNPPYVVATAQSSVPGTVSEVCVSNVTTTGFTMYILRSNNTSTNINWIAMYCG